MGLYSDFSKREEMESLDFNYDEFLEACFYEDHYADSDYEKEELLESADLLLEKGKISKKTIVRLNKNDDITRRSGMAALQLAKDNNDPLWNKLVKNRIMERKLLRAIKKKYASKARIVATKSQRAYISGTGTKGNQNVKKMNPKEMASTRSKG